jgi:peptide-methionine (R)-S-oxide reductase
MKSEKEWKKRLSKEQYEVLREKATESPGTGKFLHNKEKGVYVCAACGSELFKSETKFDSGSGWPSFYDAIGKNIELEEDNSHGMKRIEVKCKKCGGHLGHVFDDGPSDKTGKRYCINSVSLGFKKK